MNNNVAEKYSRIVSARRSRLTICIVALSLVILFLALPSRTTPVAAASTLSEPVTMTVSYQVVGEQLVMQADGSVKSFRNGVYTGAFDPPNFIFTQGGTQQSIQLAVSPFGAHPVQVDSGTTWSVDANPLLHAVDNLNGTVQWYSSQQLTGTASETTIIFIYTPQYYLTTSTDGDGGSVSPASGWYDAWTVVPITANADSSYMFQSWTGTNDGSYTGTDNPSSVTMNGPVTQQATFAFVIPENALLLIPFAIIIVVVLKRRKSRQSTP